MQSMDYGEQKKFQSGKKSSSFMFIQFIPGAAWLNEMVAIAKNIKSTSKE